MEQQKQIIPKVKGLKSYCQSWKQFFDRAVQIIVDHPTTSRYVFKYNSKKHAFILKVTNGTLVVLKHANAATQYDEVQRFTKLAARALTNESDKKVQENKEDDKDPKKKKNKKKR